MWQRGDFQFTSKHFKQTPPWFSKAQNSQLTILLCWIALNSSCTEPASSHKNSVQDPVAPVGNFKLSPVIIHNGILPAGALESEENHQLHPISIIIVISAVSPPCLNKPADLPPPSYPFWILALHNSLDFPLDQLPVFLNALVITNMWCT